MTQDEWLASDDPVAMLEALKQGEPCAGRTQGQVDRRMRLFACACCWGVSADLGREAEILEADASGVAAQADKWARAWAGDQSLPAPAARAALLRDIVGNPWREWKRTATEIYRIEGVNVTSRVRLTPTVLGIAQTAYDERRDDGSLDPDRLAVLADALEDADCADPDIIGHLRGPGPHVRGCAILDLILGKA